MPNSVQTLSTEKPSSSVQETETDVQKMQERIALLPKENSLERGIIKRLESIEEGLDQIEFFDDQDQKGKADESLNFVKKKLKQLKNFVSLSKEKSQETKIKRLEFEFIEKEFDQIFIEDQDQNIRTDDGINFIKRKLKQVKSLVSQYEKQQKWAKHPSFSDQQQLSEAKESRKMFEDWQKLSVEKQILASPMMNNLLRGYDILDEYLRICLLSFAVFPENEVIKKRPLIYWWMAEGFIKKSDKESAEEAGESLFRELIERGIIQPGFKNDKTPMVDRCTLHPWIRRMLISKAGPAEIFDLDEMGRLNCNVAKSRCLCFPMDGKDSLGENFWKRDLWTMFNVNESYLSVDEDFLSKFEKVKILQLGSWQSSPYHHIEVENDKFLNNLWALKHLKYLSLRGISRITTLPSSITKCHNLEILDLKGCHTLESLPSDFGPLRKLTHLDFSECYLLESMPDNQHKLFLLQVLKGFDAEKYFPHRMYKSSAWRFGQLENLRKLSVLLGTKESQYLVSDLQWLFSIKNLRILTLTWRMDSPKSDEQSKQKEEKYDGEEDENQYRNLENLEKLELRCFPFRKRPIRLSPNTLKNLKRLYVRGGQLEELIGAGNVTDHEWHVEILRLKHLKNLKLGSDQVRKFFPRLSYFEMTVFHQNDAEKHDEVSWRKDLRRWKINFPHF